MLLASKLFVLSLCLSTTLADFKLPNFDNVGNILQTIKSTGMMDQFQEQFTQMMMKQKAKRDESVEDEDEVRPRCAAGEVSPPSWNPPCARGMVLSNRPWTPTPETTYAWLPLPMSVTERRVNGLQEIEV